MNKKKFIIIILTILRMFLVFKFNDYNTKRAVDACLAASQKLSDTKINDLEEAKKFCEEQIKSNR